MKKGKSINSIMAIIAFVCSVASIFVMYYILAIFSFVTSLVTIKDESTKNLAVVSLIIVCITFVLKLLYYIIEKGNPPHPMLGLFLQTRF